jgi:hypothetical protein
MVSSFETSIIHLIAAQEKIYLLSPFSPKDGHAGFVIRRGQLIANRGWSAPRKSIGEPVIMESSDSKSRPGKRVAIIGNDGKIRNAHLKTPAQLFSECGNNTGNLAFWFAVWRHIGSASAHYIPWNFDPDHVRNEYDIVVFVAANQLNPAWDLGALADSLERCNRPLVVVGLGAQAPDYGTKVELTPGTIRLLKVFSERCVRIGMRGQYSAEVAMAYGVKNVVVTGCPSNFLNTAEPYLGRVAESRFRAIVRPYRLALNLDLNGHLKPVIRRSIDWLKEWGGFLIVQSPLSALYLAFAQNENVSDSDLQLYSRLLLNRSYDEESRRFLYTQFVSFFDVECWINSLRGCRISFGTRIHGNLLALQAGVPTFIIPHDARTRELAETIGMPIVEQNDFVRAESLQSLLRQIPFSGEAYDRKRIQLAVEYVSLLRDSGVHVAPELVQLSNSSPASEHTVSTAV